MTFREEGLYNAHVGAPYSCIRDKTGGCQLCGRDMRRDQAQIAKVATNIYAALSPEESRRQQAAATGRAPAPDAPAEEREYSARRFMQAQYGSAIQYGSSPSPQGHSQDFAAAARPPTSQELHYQQLAANSHVSPKDKIVAVARQLYERGFLAEDDLRAIVAAPRATEEVMGKLRVAVRADLRANAPAMAERAMRTLDEDPCPQESNTPPTQASSTEPSASTDGPTDDGSW